MWTGRHRSGMKGGFFMSLFGGVIQISGITFLLVCVFIIMALGYMLGRIKIKGVDLGTAVLTLERRVSSLSRSSSGACSISRLIRK